jgi:hypothetical protein
MPEAPLNHLAAELFRTFSRFEYSLKAAGFHRGDGDAEPDWRTFALSIEAGLQNPNGEELREAIDYILHNPPKKQVIRNGVLEWSDAPPTTNSRADLILLYVRRVRNNLFHGGKFNGRWFEPERSKVLLRCSLVILQGCLEASPQVRNAYDN